MFGVKLTPEAGGLFNPQTIERAVDGATTRNLAKSGAYIMRVARNSLKPGRQKRLSDLTPDERQVFRIKQSLFKAGKIDKKPKRPTIPSKPGEPPRLQRPSKYLKIMLRFETDQGTTSVVVGSARIAREGLAPAALEKGDSGHHLAPRPYMVPALRKEVSQMAKRWENSITK